jgi:hypothetical protein
MHIASMKSLIILLFAMSFISFGWSSSYYLTTPTHASVGVRHGLNNHGTMHYLTDEQWRAYISLNVGAGVAFLIAVILNWLYKPFRDR